MTTLGDLRPGDLALYTMRKVNHQIIKEEWYVLIKSVVDDSLITWKAYDLENHKIWEIISDSKRVRLSSFAHRIDTWRFYRDGVQLDAEAYWSIANDGVIDKYVNHRRF